MQHRKYNVIITEVATTVPPTMAARIRTILTEILKVIV